MQFRELNRCSESDIQILAELFNEYAASAKTEFSPTIAQELADVNCFRGFVVSVNDSAVGFAVIYETYSSYRSRPVWNLHDLMISARVRGQGCGRAFMRFLLEQAKHENVVKVTLEVNENNEVAKRLYQSFGFEDFRSSSPNDLHYQTYLD